MFDLLHVLRVQQCVKPLSDHKFRNSFVDMSHLGVLTLVLTLAVLTLVLTLVLSVVLTLEVWTLEVLTLEVLTLVLLTLGLTLELILVLLLSTLDWACIIMLCHHATDIGCKILEITAKANVQQFLEEFAARLEACLCHLAQPTPHS